jgi:hypothetical protein
MDAEKLFHHRAEADAGQAEQPGGQFGVEDADGIQADLAQAGQVLAGGVQDPLLIGESVVELCEVADRRRVEEEGASAPAVDLDQVSTLGVGETGRALGIDADRADAG